MKRIMSYILIILGALAIIGGISMLTHRDAPKTTPLAESHTKIESHSTDKPEVVTAKQDNTIENEAPKEESDVTSPQSKSKDIGDAFEDFVVNLLADYRFTLLDRTQDAVSSAGVVAESCKNPDLHVQQKRGNSNIDYYIECKYRSNWKNNAVTFEKSQIDRYHQFQRDNHRKVLIALGVGGSPDAPATFLIIPLDSLKGNTIRKIDTKFAVEPTPSALIGYMNTYFSLVFKNSKSRDK